MWGQRLRSQLDLLLPDAEHRTQEAQDHQEQAHDSHSVDEHFDTVYAKNYGHGPQLLPGCVVGFLGSAMYRVQLCNNHVIVRHADQLRHRVYPDEITSLSEDCVPETGVSTGVAEPQLSEDARTVQRPQGLQRDRQYHLHSRLQTLKSRYRILPLRLRLWFPCKNWTHQNCLQVGIQEFIRSSRVRRPPVRFEGSGMLLNN